MCLVAFVPAMNDVSDATEMGVFLLALMTLWLYLPGFIANTFAMMWGKWLPKTGYGPWPIDGGRVMSDGNRMLGDGKTWNGLIGGSLTAGLLCMLQVAIVGTSFDEASVFVSPLTGSEGAWFSIGGPWLTAYILGVVPWFCLSSGRHDRIVFSNDAEASSEKVMFPQSTTTRHSAVCNHGFLWGQLFLGPRSLPRMNYFFQWP